jgi:EAL domain-containing protein (putative c-di-GMP-specific phosphodiesterase class I)
MLNRSRPSAPSTVGTPTCAELLAAITAGELELRYQPIIDLRTGVVVSLEALVRWRHRTLGLLSADSFVPAAEECGLVGRLDDWVLEATCRQIEEWQQDVLVGPGFRVAVNVSGCGLADDQLVAKVESMLSASGASPMCLTIELTETSDLTNVDVARDTMCLLRAMGVRMALDDFGAAYATFERLRHLPFDSIKIDKAVMSSAERPVGEAFIVAAVDLGRSLGMSVIAEGIETEELATVARRLGCDEGQGYLWSPVLTAAETGTLLETGVLRGA